MTLIQKWQRFDPLGALRSHWNPLAGFYALLMILFVGFLQVPGAAARTPAPAPASPEILADLPVVDASRFVFLLAEPKPSPERGESAGKASSSRLSAVADPVPQAGGHSALLTWILSTDDTTTACTTTANCLQNVYRAPATCTTFTLLTTTALSATTTTFTDSTITPGVWCYGVTFEINGLESVKDTVTVTLQPASPSGAAATVK